MEITTDDFGLEWRRADGVIHKADYDELIKAYESLDKIKSIIIEWNTGKYLYSNNHMCEIKHIIESIN